MITPREKKITVDTGDENPEALMRNASPPFFDCRGEARNLSDYPGKVDLSASNVI